MDPQALLATALRVVVIYLFLLLLMRLLGKRTVGNFSAFDLIVALLLGELVDAPIYGDVPLSQGLVAMGMVADLAFLDASLSHRSRWFDELTGGKATVVIREGEIDKQALARERLNKSELWSLLRQSQIEDIRDVKWATLEPDGMLSVVKVQPAQPVTKRDLAPELVR